VSRQPEHAPDATSTLSNTGRVYVSSGTLNIAATVGQLSGKTLTAGVWTFAGSSAGHSTLEITSPPAA
jgi:hypothetical protein